MQISDEGVDFLIIHGEVWLPVIAVFYVVATKPHLVAGLKVIGVFNPSVHPLVGVFQHASGDRGAGANARQVGGH